MLRKPAGYENRPLYRTYLVFLLATILAFNGLDGTALGLALPSIKGALSLTDTELGVLTGIAFSLFYSTVGIPLGRWADRGDRVAIIAITTALWGVMVMLVGATRSFGQLLIVRIGVAVGEAGCVPAAYSLIGDYFTREEKPRAVANYLLGGTAGLILGYLAAGWLNYRYGWRGMFVCIGVPSVVIAPVAWWTLSEPRRKERKSQTSGLGAELPSVAKVSQLLWRSRTFRYLVATSCVNAVFGSGVGVWEPSFFARSYGLGTEQLGLYFAIIYGAGGLIGTFSGGYLASRFAPTNECLQLKACVLLNAAFGILSAFIYISRNPFVSMTLLGVATVAIGLENGPIFATIQTVIPERMRAVSISVIYLFINLVGAGLGPLIVGSLSDALHPYLGAESLRYALLAMCPGFFVAGWLLWQAARGVIADTNPTTVHARGSPRVTCAQV